MNPGGHSRSYFGFETIAAIGTNPGSALGIIRVSGGDSEQIVRSIAGEKNVALAVSSPKKLIRSRFYLKEHQILDDGFLVFFEEGKSFTGEKSFELYLHGGAFSLLSIIDALIIAGAKQALPGEFSFRALRNGKQSISQVEAIHDLIKAPNQEAATLALEKMEGSQQRVIGEVADQLRGLLSRAELGIDFSDQEVPELELGALKSVVDGIWEQLDRLENSFERGSRIQEGVKLALVGPPNVGKSSLFNALLAEERAIVSEVAGTTRDVLKETITLKSASATCSIRILDTAGIRNEKSAEAIEKIGIQRSLQAVQEADIVLVLISQEDQIDKREFYSTWKKGALLQNHQKVIGVITKIDLVGEKTLQVQKDWIEKFTTELKIEDWIGVSSKTLEGVQGLVEKIVEVAQRWVKRSPGEVLITKKEQAIAIRNAKESLLRAQNSPTADLFAADIRVTLKELEPIIGQTNAEMILTKIFSEFCIGK